MGKPEGSLCGSQHINEEFLEFLKKKAKVSGPAEELLVGVKKIKANESDLRRWCRIARWNVPDALRSANDQFEDIKRNFDTGNLRKVVRLETPDGNYRWRFEIDSELMERFWQPVLAKIKKHVESQFCPQTRLVVMAGAISKSPYFMKKIRGWVEELNFRHSSKCLVIEGNRDAALSMSHTVCNGALHRFAYGH